MTKFSAEIAKKISNSNNGNDKFENLLFLNSDFKFDNYLTIAKPDYSSLNRIGKEGVKLLIRIKGILEEAFRLGRTPVIIGRSLINNM